MAEVIKTIVTESEISSEIDLGLDGVPKKIQSRVKKDVGEFLIEQTLLSLGQAKTPVAGASFKKTLSKTYKKEKLEAGRSGVADLEFDGDMKDSFTFKPTETGIKIGHFSAKEAPKADGHNNFSGESQLPERRYLPKEGEAYKREIQSEIDRIVADAIISETPVPESRLEAIESPTEFWELMTTFYEGFTKAEIRASIMRNEDFVETLTRLGMLKWLK